MTQATAIALTKIPVFFAEHQENNALHRKLGLPEVPLGVDPLSHGN